MEEKIFELMAAAEDLQTHAAKLQVSAEEVFSAIPKAVEQAEKKVRLAVEQVGQEVESRLRSVWLHGAVYLLAVGAVVCGVSVAFISWQTSSLREEAAELRSTLTALKTAVADEQNTLQDLSGKTWRLELVKWEDSTRGIILPKGLSFVRTGKMRDGREAIVLQ